MHEFVEIHTVVGEERELICLTVDADYVIKASPVKKDREVISKLTCLVIHNAVVVLEQEREHPLLDLFFDQGYQVLGNIVGKIRVADNLVALKQRP